MKINFIKKAIVKHLYELDKGDCFIMPNYENHVYMVSIHMGEVLHIDLTDGEAHTFDDTIIVEVVECELKCTNAICAFEEEDKVGNCVSNN